MTVKEAGVVHMICHNYRRLNGATWMGEALAVRIMGATDLWNQPAFFDYVDRWQKEEAPKSSNPFVVAMSAAYRDKADTLGANMKPKLAVDPAPPSKPVNLK